MFSVSDAEAAAIRAAYGRSGELAAAVESRATDAMTASAPFRPRARIHGPDDAAIAVPGAPGSREGQHAAFGVAVQCDSAAGAAGLLPMDSWPHGCDRGG